jgi:hypothetical protein
MTRIFVVGSILWIAWAVPALAEKITIACSYDRAQYVTVYLTIDTVAQTLKDQTGTFHAQITDESVTWNANGGRNTFNRLTGQFDGWMNNFGSVCNPCSGPYGPVPCVRVSPIF